MGLLRYLFQGSSGLIKVDEVGRYAIVRPDSDLLGALITVSDMPLGWAPGTPQEPFSKRDSTFGAPKGRIVKFRESALELAETYFARGTYGPFAFVDFMRYAPGVSKPLFDTQMDLLRQYPKWSFKAQGDTFNLQVAPLSLPVLGEESIAWRKTALPRKAPDAASYDRVLIRSGCVLIDVGQMAFGQNPTVDTEFTLRLAKLAEQRLSRIVH